MLYITFKSTVGKLNALYHHSKNVNAPVAIVVDSHSIDTETNKSSFDDATNTIVDTFIENGFSTLKFNFRKENEIEKNSKKDTDTEINNVLDLTAALDWLHSKNIESKSYWICGIDTGALPALQLVMRRPEIENYILVSPNLKKNDLGFMVPCVASGFLVRASEDLRFLEEDCVNLQEKLITKTESKISYTTIYKVDKNYITELDQLKNEIDNYIKNKLKEDYQNYKSVSINKRRRRKKRIHDTDEEKIVYINPIKSLDIDDI